ncbi:hypothetical protein F4779DRAFT_617380 [Xylariaceae sp. FL0662B]|nr:hypothetical protein F4779DRAFT_617380 [Xylariaceae sp. FL0662B]
MDTHRLLSSKTCVPTNHRNAPAAANVLPVDATLAAIDQSVPNNARRRIQENVQTESHYLSPNGHSVPAGLLLPVARRERGTEDDVISIWLSGVSTSPEYSSKENGNSIVGEPSLQEPPTKWNDLTGQNETGFDGPLSSRDGKQHSTPQDRSCEPGSSTRSSRLSGNAHRLRSDTSGSIDWEKSWPKRKPRRGHDVSEVSNSDPAHHTYAIGRLSAANDQDDSESENQSDGKLCSYAAQHDAQFHAILHLAFTSCPELHRQLDNAEERCTVSASTKPITTLTYKMYRLTEVKILSHNFVRSLARIDADIMVTRSIRSDFPAPPDGQERRIRARGSAEIWPSSGEESPIFNTPESNVGSPYSPGRHIDPLAIAGVMIATAELDRLGSKWSAGRRSRTSASSTGVSGNSLVLQTPLSSGLASPANRTPASDSAAMDTPPPIPFNTPSISAPQSGLASPAPRPSPRRGQRRRAQRSRLSEVTTPEDITPPAESADYPVQGQRSLTPRAIETLQECLAKSMDVPQDSLFPRPLTISRSSRAETENTREDPSQDSEIVHSTPDLNCPSPVRAKLTPYGITRSSSRRPDNLSSDAPRPPSRTSSIGKTSELASNLRRTPTKADDQDFASPSIPTDPEHAGTPRGQFSRKLPRDRRRTVKSDPTDGAATDIGSYVRSRLRREGITSALAIDPPEWDTRSEPESCHPDTWTESLGEPGDSDPFCPPACLESRHSSQDIRVSPPPAALARPSSTGGTGRIPATAELDGDGHPWTGGQQQPGNAAAGRSMRERKDRHSEPAWL